MNSDTKLQQPRKKTINICINEMKQKCGLLAFYAMKRIWRRLQLLGRAQGASASNNRYITSLVRHKQCHYKQ